MQNDLKFTQMLKTPHLGGQQAKKMEIVLFVFGSLCESSGNVHYILPGIWALPSPFADFAALGHILCVNPNPFLTLILTHLLVSSGVGPWATAFTRGRPGFGQVLGRNFWQDPSGGVAGNWLSISWRLATSDPSNHWWSGHLVGRPPGAYFLWSRATSRQRPFPKRKVSFRHFG